MKLSCFVLFFLLAAGSSFAQKNLFPAVDGWTLKVEEQVYDSNNLWDLINGAADLFLEYSFVDLNLARYSNGGIEVKVELYRHAGPLEAFGIYSQERDPAYKFLKIGLQGYTDEGILNFLDGEYYIKMSTIAKGAEAQKALENIGRKVSASLARKNSMPSLFSMLPGEMKIMNGEKFVLRNFMGHSFLNNAATAQYKGDTPFMVFIIESSSPEETQKILGQWKSEAGKEAFTEAGKGRYLINNPLDGKVNLATKSKFIFGIVNCDNEKTALRFLQLVEEKIK